MPVRDWEEMVDRNFDERSATIIQNDYPVNARYLLKKMLDQALLRGWREFFLISTRLCYDDAERQPGEHLVYDYQPLIDTCRTFIENGGAVRVLTWCEPEVNNFSRTLIGLHDGRYRDSITIDSMKKQLQDARPTYWLDCAISGTSYRVEVPERESQGERSSPRNNAVDVKAIACANDGNGYIRLLKKRFEYFRERAHNALPGLREHIAKKMP